MIYIMPPGMKPSSTSLVAKEVERQSSQQLEQLLEHNEILRVGFLADDGQLTICPYKADDWFGMIELNLIGGDHHPRITKDA